MDFPDDIVYNILARTPSKSLARFKCVSKHWNLMISDPEFMNSRSHRMILLPLLPFQAIDYNNKLPEKDNDYYSTVKLLDPSFNYKEYYYSIIVGTFNGILLLVHIDRIKDHMILYNPLTGDFKNIRVPPLRSFHGSSEFPCYGFGYATTQDDLKIVRLTTTSCYVFSLKNWSWSRPAKLIWNYYYHNSHAGTFVNGCLYWLLFDQHLKRLVIVALDLKKMVFSEIEIPSQGIFITLGTFKGSLCVVCCKETNNEELWVMKEDGFVLEKRLDGIKLHEWWSLVFKMTILDEGKIFKFDGTRNKFIIFDMLKDEYKEVKTITSLSQVFTSKAIEYVESWVSPSDLCS